MKIERMDQGKKSIGEQTSPNHLKPQANSGLTFGKMLERFYLNQLPLDPTDPEYIPRASLKDRMQN